jgi:hypothetical protein
LDSFGNPDPQQNEMRKLMQFIGSRKDFYLCLYKLHPGQTPAGDSHDGNDYDDEREDDADDSDDDHLGYMFRNWKSLCGCQADEARFTSIDIPFGVTNPSTDKVMKLLRETIKETIRSSKTTSMRFGAAVEALDLVIEAADTIGEAAALEEKRQAPAEEEKIDQITNIIVEGFKSDSAEDAAEMLLEVIQAMTDNDKPSGKEMKHNVSLILVSLKKRRIGDKEKVLIKAAEAIDKVVSEQIKEEEPAEAAEAAKKNVESLAIIKWFELPSPRPKLDEFIAAVSLAFNTSVSAANANAFGHSSHARAFGGRRSRTNFKRSSYKRTNNKSVAKKLKRFISRKYGLMRKSTAKKF